MKMPKTKSLSGQIALLTMTLGLIATGAEAARADVVYVTGQSDEFGTLNLSTGAFAQITSNLNTPATVFGMGTGGTNTLYVIDQPGDAYSVNATTGAISANPVYSTGLTLGGAGGTGSIVYTMDTVGDLIQVNLKTLSQTKIGSYGISPDGLVVNDGLGNIYVTAMPTGTETEDDLYKINLSTKQAVLVGSTGDSNLFAGVYDAGTLYGFDANGNINGGGGSIVTINTTTGLATTQVGYMIGTSAGGTTGDQIYTAALAPLSVPEPTSMMLLAFGGLCAAGMAAKRRFVTH